MGEQVDLGFYILARILNSASLWNRQVVVGEGNEFFLNDIQSGHKGEDYRRSC
jgi:hypothetical protein